MNTDCLEDFPPQTLSLRIAVADDELDMREYLEKILPRMGHRVVAVAENGRDLVDLCAEARPDLVITDLRMPTMDGDQAIQLIGRTHKIPFIAVSAYCLPEGFAASLPSDSWVYLNKPIKRADLESAIQRLFPQREGPPAAADAGTAPELAVSRAAAWDAAAHGVSAEQSWESDVYGPDAVAAAAERPLELLIVDDDAEFLADLGRFFRQHGCRTTTCADGRSALDVTSQRAFDVAILDMRMPEVSGLDLLRHLKASGAETEVIMLTGQGTVPTAVEAMKLGAHDFIVKPAKLKQLEAVVRRAHASVALRHENRQLRAALRQYEAPFNMIGESRQMRQVYRLIERIGPSEKPILIQGESGTGKELVARAIHQASRVAHKPLVVVNCAALPETLLESELFGHEKGAFTGAINTKPGLFEVADGGTLFIDEIGELAGALQAKLLRVLEDGSLRRIGSVKERRVQVRLLAATNREMSEEVDRGRFREDLYYRINVLTIDLPPLREREGDLPLLVQHFAGAGWQVAADVLPTLQRYGWPGNIRQLSNAMERAKILADDGCIRLENFPPEIFRSAVTAPCPTAPTAADLESLTRHHVLEVYERCRHNKARTARELGINRRSLYRLLEKYGQH